MGPASVRAIRSSAQSASSRVITRGGETPIVARMNAALRETLSEERARRQMEEAQQARLLLSDRPTLKAFLDRQVEVWGRVVRENNIRAD